MPLHLREANEFVARHHRHNFPTVGGKLALGVPRRQVGRGPRRRQARGPQARRRQDARNPACRHGRHPERLQLPLLPLHKIARLMGYERVITYTLASEGGASLGRSGPHRPARLESMSGPTRPAPEESKRLPRAEIPLGVVTGTASHGWPAEDSGHLCFQRPIPVCFRDRPDQTAIGKALPSSHLLSPCPMPGIPGKLASRSAGRIHELDAGWRSRRHGPVLLRGPQPPKRPYPEGQVSVASRTRAGNLPVQPSL